MPQVFARALRFTLKWEGGFSNDPRDAGGATNHGVSLRFLEGLPLSEADCDGDGGLTWRDVAAMTPEQAAAIYKKRFWDALRLEAFPESLAVTLFDGAVNLGRARAAAHLQRAVNDLAGPRETPLAEDGAIGRKTLEAVEARRPEEETDQRLSRRVLSLRAAHYARLARGERHRWAYGGWMRRVRDLWREVAGGEPPF